LLCAGLGWRSEKSRLTTGRVRAGKRTDFSNRPEHQPRRPSPEGRVLAALPPLASGLGATPLDLKKGRVYTLGSCASHDELEASPQLT